MKKKHHTENREIQEIVFYYDLLLLRGNKNVCDAVVYENEKI
jgi:hypothetical protein